MLLKCVMGILIDIIDVLKKCLFKLKLNTSDEMDTLQI